MLCRPLRRAPLPTSIVSPQPATTPKAPSHHSSVSPFPSTRPGDPKPSNALSHLPCQPAPRSSKDRRNSRPGRIRNSGSFGCHERFRNPAADPDYQTGQLLHNGRIKPDATVAENLPRLSVLQPDGDSPKEQSSPDFAAVTRPASLDPGTGHTRVKPRPQPAVALSPATRMPRSPGVPAWMSHSGSRPHRALNPLPTHRFQVASATFRYG